MDYNFNLFSFETTIDRSIESIWKLLLEDKLSLAGVFSLMVQVENKNKLSYTSKLLLYIPLRKFQFLSLFATVFFCLHENKML
jgi:hypothetical protein